MASWQGRAVAGVFAVVALFGTVVPLLPDVMVPATYRLGFLAISGVLVFLFFVLCVIEFVRIAVAPSEIDVSIPPSQFRCRVLDSYEDARYLNEKLVPRLFEGVTPPIEAALQAQEINNQRLVGIIDDTNQSIAGWAAIWPLKVEAGRRVQSGETPDDQIEAADILPKSYNHRASYLCILAFGILPEYCRLPARLFPKLASAVLWHIHDEFIREPGRKVTLLAVAFSREGRRMCEMLGMTPNGNFVRYRDGSDPKPIFQHDISQEDIRLLLKNAFN